MEVNLFRKKTTYKILEQCFYFSNGLYAATALNTEYFYKIHTLPEMTDIINILIRWKFAYHVEFGFICDY